MSGPYSRFAMLRDKLAILTTTVPNLYQDALLIPAGTATGRAAATAAMATKGTKQNRAVLPKLKNAEAQDGGGGGGRQGGGRNANSVNNPRGQQAKFQVSQPQSTPRTVSGGGPLPAKTASFVPALVPPPAMESTIKDPPPGEAGSWQTIVAWLPATIKTPEPWQPLTSDVAASLARLTGAPGSFDVTAAPGLLCKDAGALKAGGGQAWTEKATLVIPGDSLSDDACDVRNSESGSADEKREEFEVIEAFKKREEDDPKPKNRLKGSRSRMMPVRDGVDHEESTSGGKSEVPKSRFIVNPHSKHRIMWDLASLSMVVYDMAMIPMSSFDLPENTFLTSMDWTTRLFWTIDVAWSCITGVVLKDGTVQYDPKFILMRYLRTWFPLDCIIVSTDWVEVAITSMNTHSGAGFLAKLSRSMRVVRVVRLLRLVRMREVLDVIFERIQSDHLAMLLNNLKIVVFIISFGHITGCIYWAVGNRGDSSWIHASDYESKSLDAQYLLCLHWALSQLSGGMGEVPPEKSLERLYTVIHFIVSFMTAAIIISALTSSMTQSHIIRGHQSQSVSVLRKYLKQNSISSNLALRVQRSAQHAISGDLTVDSVDLLQVVSEPLRVEVNFEMYCPVLRHHPFFELFLADSPHVLRKICHSAMSTLLMATDDQIFAEGDTASQMYFVFWGSLVYESDAGDRDELTGKMWIGEPTLWTNWMHRGTLVATSDVKVACLNARLFQEHAANASMGLQSDPKVYAAEYVKAMNASQDVTDLFKYKKGDKIEETSQKWAAKRDKEKTLDTIG
eukprot:TRINITY_DN23505_c0_g2_i2.p1 TRINITY_DN23505_c0_g2~~TRINITY_DN23505_c0_g2_i2.p1  ORF type:complete len:790 (+),score=133.57 TRINITY_DN23505_c0_g2_i2:239-2608(+)